ncbi:MAG: hypothetical protein AAGF20_11455 [Pseudomonadota bacterium]
MRRFLIPTVLVALLATIFTASANEDLRERFEDGDPSVVPIVEACANTDAVCASIKGEGLYFGDGWEEDLTAAKKYLTFAANAGDVAAMTNLAYIYSEPDTPDYDSLKAAQLYGKAAMLSEPGVDQQAAVQEFYFQEMNDALTFQNWRALPLGEPIFRKSYGMGYYNWDKPSVPNPEMLAKLEGARTSIGEGRLELFDEFNVRKGVAMKYAIAYRAYADMLDRGLGVAADPTLAERFRNAAMGGESR